MKIYTIAIATLSSLMTMQSHAEDLWPLQETTTSSPFVTASVGPGWTTSGNSKTFYLQSDIRKTYNVTNNSQAFATAELFGGWQMPIGFNLLFQLGVEGKWVHNAELSGSIWEDADSDFNNYNYTYQVNRSQVSAKGKLLSDVNMIVQPYVSASIGYGMNSAHDFTITPKIYEEVPAPAFLSRNVRGLNYAFGIGIQKVVNASWQFGVGYEFANLGKTGLGDAPDQTVNTGIKQSHLFTNQLLFSASYVFVSKEGRS